MWDKAKTRDEIMNADLKEVSRAVMTVADSLQNFKPSVQLACVAYMFLRYSALTCQAPIEVLGAASSMSCDADGKRPEFKAADEYLKKEVLKI